MSLLRLSGEPQALPCEAVRLTGNAFPSLCLSPGLPVPWDKTILKVGQIITLQQPFSVQVKEITSLTLTQKPEMSQLSEEVMESHGRPGAGPLETDSHAVNAKGRCSRAIKSAPPVQTRMVRERNGLIADTEEG